MAVRDGFARNRGLTRGRYGWGVGSLSVRAAVAADLPAIAEIYAHYVTSSVATFDESPPADWDQRLVRGLPFVVATSGADVLGYSYASPWKPKNAYRYTVEDAVYVAPGHGGQGLGTMLLGALLDSCQRAGIQQVIAVIADGNGNGKASVALHRRFGFEPAGTLRAVGFKFGRWLDTSLLQRTLGLPARHRCR
jgi:L-amino acid N-acyltransferase YncA